MYLLKTSDQDPLCKMLVIEDEWGQLMPLRSPRSAGEKD